MLIVRKSSHRKYLRRSWLFLLVVLFQGLFLLSTVQGFQRPATPGKVWFRLTDMTGGSVESTQFLGQWMVVNFWATWCGPCIEELPELATFHRRHINNDVTVVGINYESTDLDLVNQFLADFDLPFPLLRIGEKPLLPIEPLIGLPTTALVDPDGNLVAVHVGPVTVKMLEAAINAARAGELVNSETH